MPLESATYISDLVVTNPAATDGLGQSDDHHRLIKATVKATFPNITGAVTATHGAINTAAAAASDGVIKAADGALATPSLTFAADLNTGFFRPGADQITGVVGGTAFMAVTADLKVSFKGAMESVGAFAALGNATVAGTLGVTGAASFSAAVTAGSYAGGTGQLVFTGAVIACPFPTVPTGYLECDGTAVSRTTYAALFAAIGTTFGAGDGTTTFNVPDCCGRVIAGFDSGNATGRLNSAVSASAIANAGGAQNHTLTTAETPVLTGTTNSTGAHTHTVTPSVVYSNGGSAVVAGGTSFPLSAATPTTVSDGAHSHTVTVNSGGGDDHNNVQPTIIMKWVIKT